jgi:transporter family protein
MRETITGQKNETTWPRENRYMAEQISWQWFALGSAFFAGLTAIFGKVGVAEINSNLATLIRTLVILAVSAVIVTGRGEWEPLSKLSRRGVLMLCLSGVATGLSWLCYYRALQTGPASRVAPVDKLSVVFVIVLAVLFLGEPPTWRALLGGSLVTLGSIALATT